MYSKIISTGSVVATLLVAAFVSEGASRVTLLDSHVFSSVSVTSNTPGTTNTFTSIDLHDTANMLVLAVPGETVDITGVSFGGTPMTLTKSFVQSTYAKVRFFTLSDPNTASGQTLSIESKNTDSTINGGYSPQLFSFSNVEGLGDTPEAGSASAATVTLDFGSVTNNSYLLMTAAAQDAGNPSFEAPATNLTEIATGLGGWSARTGGEQISADAGSKMVSVISGNRVAAIGLELLPPPPPPAGTVLIVR